MARRIYSGNLFWYSDVDILGVIRWNFWSFVVFLGLIWLLKYREVLWCECFFLTDKVDKLAHAPNPWNTPFRTLSWYKTEKINFERGIHERLLLNSINDNRKVSLIDISYSNDSQNTMHNNQIQLQYNVFHQVATYKNNK